MWKIEHSGLIGLLSLPSQWEQLITISFVTIVQQWLVDKLNDNIGEVVLADGGYNERGQYFIMPSE